MDINIAQLLVNASVSLLVGGVSAWIAGTFGVRHGVEKAKRERAFDRRLDWYERTFRAFNTFTITLNNLIPPPLEPEALKRVVRELGLAVQEARNCVDAAPVYAERKTMVEMRKLFVELGQVTHLVSGPKIETSDLLKKRNATVEIVNGIECELAMSIREQLGLDKISEKDFRWEKTF